MLQQNEVCRKSQNQLDDSRRENEVDRRLGCVFRLQLTQLKPLTCWMNRRSKRKSHKCDFCVNLKIVFPTF